MMIQFSFEKVVQGKKTLVTRCLDLFDKVVGRNWLRRFSLGQNICAVLELNLD